MSVHAIQDNLNPQFTKSLVMEYYFEMRQTLRVVCYDMDNPRLPLEKQDYLGACRVRSVSHTHTHTHTHTRAHTLTHT